MKNNPGFSLAEALITLLIVSIIAVMSAPILTKKAQKRPDEQPWLTSGKYNNALYPSGYRDIILGEVSAGHPQSIVVTGRLEFKNRAGQTIGWISEDGSSSFAQSVQTSTAPEFDYNAMMQNQKQIMELLTSLQQILSSSRNSSAASSSRIKSRRSSYDSNTPNISEEQLQKQLDELMKNMNNNVYGR